MKKTIIPLLLGMLISGCSTDSDMEKKNIQSFTASLENTPSRTFMEDGKYICWTKDDRITIFKGTTYGQEYVFDGVTGDRTGTFTPITEENEIGSLNANYAVYPHTYLNGIDDSGVMTVQLPANQDYAENSFGVGASTMVAVTKDINDRSLSFKNTCGCLKLKLYGDNVTVKSIVLQGNNKEPIAGDAIVTCNYGENPTLKMGTYTTKTITLHCEGKGVRIGNSAETATTFWLVVPPITFTKGFSITVNNVGVDFVKSTSKNISIERNVILPMSAALTEGTSGSLIIGNGWQN